MQKAIDNGVVLEGYLHWSLLDNFEWDKGRWPRFGLAAVNYDTLERKLRPSALWFGKVIKHLRENV
jgi:beta-glucosidase